MAAEHAAEPAKLHVCNTLLDQSLRTLNQWREQAEERNRELFIEHENAMNCNTAAFATVLQSMTLKYHAKQPRQTYTLLTCRVQQHTVVDIEQTRRADRLQDTLSREIF
ncbi:hypothetical protein AJ78_09057 [Emergomyces pasteurianus Ep9510]|uniref:Uncharacterized protein n=1 Tax=Emergomyces pasteurianus Ep9510 TaxID=1447872 RepID=A0A1J9Q0I8_9EURO|nr:hypothetical protein AJ78_09057 [Emergomyces pasteurianus Ep9510]